MWEPMNSWMIFPQTLSVGDKAIVNALNKKGTKGKLQVKARTFVRRVCHHPYFCSCFKWNHNEKLNEFLVLSIKSWDKPWWLTWIYWVLTLFCYIPRKSNMCLTLSFTDHEGNAAHLCHSQLDSVFYSGLLHSETLSIKSWHDVVD